MQQFKLTVPNNGTVTGAHCIPPPSNLSSEHRPLVVGLHGGTYDHHYFDATPKYSASVTSIALNIPFVSIDRPSFGGTSSIVPISEDFDFPQESGKWLHQYILPKLWTEFGVPSQCNSVVLLCHSLGVMGGTIAAALHAHDENPLYPLGGLIASGMGDSLVASGRDQQSDVDYSSTEYTTFPLDAKDAIMFKPRTVAGEVLQESARLNAPTPVAEINSYATKWIPIWKEKWAALVTVPVLFALVDNDPFFVVNEEELETCVKAFRKSVRVDGSLVKDAPHCIELSFWSQGWYARCFGFAMECSAAIACCT